MTEHRIPGTKIMTLVLVLLRKTQNTGYSLRHLIGMVVITCWLAGWLVGSTFCLFRATRRQQMGMEGGEGQRMGHTEEEEKGKGIEVLNYYYSRNGTTMTNFSGTVCIDYQSNTCAL